MIRVRRTTAALALGVMVVAFLFVDTMDTTSAGSPAANQGLLSDRVLFEQKINLDYPGLGEVRRDVKTGDLAAARHDLAEYYRRRTGKFLPLDLSRLASDSPKRVSYERSVQSLTERTGAYDSRLWKGDVFDWSASHVRNKERMYLLGSIGQVYAATGDERIAVSLIDLMRSFVITCPPGQTSAFWASMTVGIRMRTGWPEAFLALLRSPYLTDDDLIHFLKSAYQQSSYILEHHSATSNWLTFEMAGLYTSGVVYPEFREASHWREFARETAVSDLDIGWLPDGMSIELTPGYGQFFSNYLGMYDLARYTGRASSWDRERFVAKTEPLFNLYLKIMAPDRSTPATNDNLPVNVVSMLSNGLNRFPNRQDFRWIVTDGKSGAPPDFTSVVLPYAGYAAMRSGWGRSDNMLYFDFGPVGYRHAHQDKLEVMIWAYGRQVLYDSGRTNYADTPHQNYCMDTFSHNTVLVDDRPQRRKWYNDPNPAKRPYPRLTDYEWKSNAARDFARGVYDDNYGLPGPSDAYPYKKGGNFNEGWGKPAFHSRRVLFYKPDIFVVADTLISRDGKSHIYDARWNLDSTHVQRTANGLEVSTKDPGEPNLEVIPLLTHGLTVRTASAQDHPEILGWRVVDRSYPATTVEHVKAGPGTVQLLTLLLPLKPGQSSLFQSVRRIGASTFEIALRDGRRFRLDAPPDPMRQLVIHAVPDLGPDSHH